MSGVLHNNIINHVAIVYHSEICCAANGCKIHKQRFHNIECGCLCSRINILHYSHYKVLRITCLEISGKLTGQNVKLFIKV